MEEVSAGGKIIVEQIRQRILQLNRAELHLLLNLIQEDLGPPDIGVREPRTPHPSIGGAAIALDQPETDDA